MTKLIITNELKKITLNGGVTFQIKPGMLIARSKRRIYIVTIANEIFIRAYRGSKEGLVRETFYGFDPFNISHDEIKTMNEFQKKWNTFISADVTDPCPILSSPVMEISHYGNGDVSTVDHRHHKDDNNVHYYDDEESDSDYYYNYDYICDNDYDDSDCHIDDDSEYSYEKFACDRDSLCFKRCPFKTYCDSFFVKDFGKLPCKITEYDPVIEYDDQEISNKVSEFFEFISDDGNLICEE